MGRLDDLDLKQKLKRKQQDARLASAALRLTQLRLTLGGLTGSGELGPALIVQMEGWDASGKGGAIRRLVAPLDPRHVRVVSYSAPSPDEKRHHFLHRFNAALPGLGGMAVFDRTWYGRVLVERVEKFATKEEWQRAYEQITEHERMLHAEGAIIVKFWMHISDEEQKRRFERRAKDPLKNWKLTDEDWRNREKRPAYIDAIEEMFERTDIPEAPWHPVAAESKRYARVNVVETVIAEIERGCAERDFMLPEPLPGD